MATDDAGQWDLAEMYCLKLKEDMDSYTRCEQMSRLASIWHARGETEQAPDLLAQHHLPANPLERSGVDQDRCTAMI